VPARLITKASVRITKEQQIADRRQAVLTLSAQNLTQHEIAKKLVISQKTVSNDLEWLRRDSVQYVKQNKEEIAFEYKQVMSNLYQLRKLAWQHLNSATPDNVKISLYSIIENINSNIMTMLSTGDLIEMEIKQAEQEIKGIEEGLTKAVD
jgi:DNA-binding CsgD family transcriptional regulator